MAPIDIFQTISTGPLPRQIPSRADHPAPRINIERQDRPIQTNKFYANLFLGSQGQSVWTHPYSVVWSKGSGNAGSWGLSISHIDDNQKAFGPANTSIPGHPVRYFINPIGIQSLILSAAELGPAAVLASENLEAFSAQAILRPFARSANRIAFPLVQGMGFVTGVYTNLELVIQSSVFFRTVAGAGSPKSGIFKYRITLEDGKNWLLYAKPNDGRDPQLSLASNSKLQGPRNWSGVIQVAKNPDGAAGEAVYDASAGVYATDAKVSGSTDGTTGTYHLAWNKAGGSSKLIMYALPHHVQSFDGPTAGNIKSLRLQTTSKGLATGVVADSWTFVERNLPTDIGFAPWSPSRGSVTNIPAAATQIIKDVANSEVRQDMDDQSNLDSMYFSGKALSKFATLLYTIHDLVPQPSLAREGLARLKSAFARFAENRQKFPLAYETAWKGVVSTGSYVTGKSDQDFGNTFYNDHHFHYGYFIHAAAVIAYLDPGWLSSNKDWVNMLVRDAANPSTQDPFFPFSRAFDWYHGHSWAKGLFESADSKDEESSSEDAFVSYALKMWGRVTGDRSMEARGTLMLAIQARTLKSYFLFESDNRIQPANFIANKVAGILFENKLDHATYFGLNNEFIQGIHMIPINPSSAYTRTARFVREEWESYFDADGPTPANTVVGGWRGILFANLAIIDPKAAWRFFTQGNFNPAWLDGGATRTWYLAYTAALGGI